jgi:hypothetical protein
VGPLASPPLGGIVGGVVEPPLPVEGEEGEVEAFPAAFPDGLLLLLVLPEGIVVLPVAVPLLLPVGVLLWLNPAVPGPSFEVLVAPSFPPPPPQAAKRTQRNAVVIGFEFCNIYTPIQVRISSLKCIVIVDLQ